MNLAQRITIGIGLLLMGLASYQYIQGKIYQVDYVPSLLFVAFVAAGLFFLFGIKRKKKNKE
jgi:hypothetical protein